MTSSTIETLLEENDRKLGAAQLQGDHRVIAGCVRSIVNAVSSLDRRHHSGDNSSVMELLEQKSPNFYNSFPFLCDKLQSGIDDRSSQSMIEYMLKRMETSRCPTSDSDTKAVMNKVSKM